MSLNKKFLLFTGWFLLICAIFFYLILHNLEKIAIFTYLLDKQNLAWLLDWQNKIQESLNLSHNFLLKNYLVDALWFSAFFMIFSYFWQKPTIISKNFLIYCIASSLEILQFFYPRLGVFDIFDIFLYTFLLIILTLFEVKLLKSNT